MDRSLLPCESIPNFSAPRWLRRSKRSGNNVLRLRSLLQRKLISANQTPISTEHCSSYHHQPSTGPENVVSRRNDKLEPILAPVGSDVRSLRDRSRLRTTPHLPACSDFHRKTPGRNQHPLRRSRDGTFAVFVFLR